MSDLVERLLSEKTVNLGDIVAVRALLEQCSETAGEAAAEILRLRERLAEAEKVMEPFAGVADTEDEVGRNDPEDDRVWVVQAYGCQLADLTVEDFRAARRWMEGRENG